MIQATSRLKEKGNTYLYLGPLPFQTIEVSSESSSSISHPSPPSPTQELPRPQTTPPNPSKLREPQEPRKRVLRRVKSDRFDPIEYQKTPDGFPVEVTQVPVREVSEAFEVDSDFGTEYSWTAPAKTGYPSLLKNEKNLMVQRVIDRDQIIVSWEALSWEKADPSGGAFQGDLFS